MHPNINIHILKEFIFKKFQYAIDYLRSMIVNNFKKMTCLPVLESMGSQVISLCQSGERCKQRLPPDTKVLADQISLGACLVEAFLPDILYFAKTDYIDTGGHQYLRRAPQIIVLIEISKKF